jgi:branched-chain amino acid transport system substrate-binding protein
VLELGKVADGVVHNSAGLPQPGTPLQEFYDLFEESKGSAPESVYSAVGGDAALVLDAAVTAAGSTDPQAVRDALAELQDVEGYTGPITYAGTNRMPIKQITVVEIEGGERSVVDEVIPDAADIPAP